MIESADTESGLKGQLRPLQFFSIAFGAMVGVGWIPLLGIWLASAGSLGASLAFLAGGGVISLVVFAYIRVAKRYPVSGGEAAYTLKIFGDRPGFLVGWLLSFCYIAACVFEAISAGWITGTLIPGIEGPALYGLLGEDVRLGTLLIGLTVTGLLCWLHIHGTDWAARFQDIMTLGLVVVSLAFILAGLLFGDFENLHPMVVFQERGWRWAGIASVVAVTPLFYGGFNFAVQAIGEKAEGVSVRQIGLMLSAAIVAAAVFFAAVILAAAMSMPRTELLAESMPAAAAFRAVFDSRILGDLVLIAGLLGLITSWNALIFAAVRILYAMAHANVMPAAFGRVHPTHGTPVMAILFVSVITFVGTFAGIGAIAPIIGTAGMAIAFAYVMVCLGALRLNRLEGADSGQPAWLIPSATGAAITVFCVAIFEPYISRPELHLPSEWAAIGIWLLIGVAFWRVTRGATI